MDRGGAHTARGNCLASSRAGATSRLPFAGGRWNPNRGLEIEGQPRAERRGPTGRSTTSSRPGCSNRCACPLRRGPRCSPTATATARRWSPSSTRRWRAASGRPARRSARASARATIRKGSGARSSASSPTFATTMPISRRCRISMCRWRSSRRRTMTLTLRTAGDPAGACRAAAAAQSPSSIPNQPLYDVRTMREVWEADLSRHAHR